jgi:hypothetical protein
MGIFNEFSRAVQQLHRRHNALLSERFLLAKKAMYCNVSLVPKTSVFLSFHSNALRFGNQESRSVSKNTVFTF